MAPRKPKKAAVSQPTGYPVAPQAGNGRGVQLPPPPTVMPRAPVHQPVRPALHSGEVRGRDGIILSRNNRLNEMPSQFDIPDYMWEKGWEFQWVNFEIHGKPQLQNLHLHYENGWRNVPSERWPGYWHPVEYKGNIQRDDVMLMERPTALSEQAKFDGVQAAKRQKHNQSASFKGVEKLLAETPGGSAGFAEPDAEHASRARDRPFVKRTVEQAPISSYPSRQLAVGDES